MELFGVRDFGNTLTSHERLMKVSNYNAKP